MFLVLKVYGLKIGLIGGAPCLPWPVGWLNRFFAFTSNRPWAWHWNFDGFEVEKDKENEDDEDWKWFWEAIWIKNGLRVRNLERENSAEKPRLNLGSRDLDVENGVWGWFWVNEVMGNDFRDSNWCKKGKRWSILEWERVRKKRLLEREKSGWSNEGGRWTTYKVFESGLPDFTNRLAG